MWPESHRSVPREAVVRTESRGLSLSARNRLRNYLDSLDRKKCSHFITLTFGGEVTREQMPPWKAKNRLAEFGRWFVWSFPWTHAVWRLENQERGVPHFHVVAYGVVHLPNKEVHSAWAARGGGFTRTKRVLDANVTDYMCKLTDEMSKTTQNDFTEDTGRCWNTWGDNAMYVSEPYEGEVSLERFRELVATLDRYRGMGALRQPISAARLSGRSGYFTDEDGGMILAYLHGSDDVSVYDIAQLFMERR